MKNVFLLPTKKESRLTILITDSFQGFDFSSYKKPLNTWHKPQHIYIINDEGTKKRDWCLHQIQHEYYLEQAHEDNALLHYKIILTTDTELIADGVQAIPDDFIEWFVKNHSCKEVEVVKMLQVRHGVDWHDLPNQTVGRETDGIYREIYKLIVPEDYSGVHFRHCYQGEYEDGCKYGEVDCPAKPKEEPTQKELRERLFNLIETLEQEDKLEVTKHPTVLSENGNELFFDEQGNLIKEKSKQGALEEFVAKWQLKQIYSEEEVINLLRKAHFVEQNIDEWFAQNKKK